MSVTMVVTGASGLLGRAVYKELKQNSPGWLIQGLALSRCTDELLKVDITSRSSVQQVFQRCKPKFVIHCAAERRPDVMAKNAEAARKLNIGATQIICEEAAAVNAHVLYVSTDYVFDGTKPPYSEEDQTNPLNEYGISKLEGEKIVLSSNHNNVVLRVPILYGALEYISESAVTSLFSSVKSRDVVCSIDNVQRRYPTHCDDVACVVRQLLEKRIEHGRVGGVYQWSGRECMTKYEMVVAMGSALGLSTNHLRPDNSQPVSGAVTRPHDTHLSSSNLEASGIDGRWTPFHVGIVQCLTPFL